MNKEKVKQGQQGDLIKVLVQNAKMMDKVYAEYQLELKQFEIEVESLIAKNKKFEKRIISKY